MLPLDKVKEIVTKHDLLEKNYLLEISIKKIMQKFQKNIQV